MCACVVAVLPAAAAVVVVSVAARTNVLASEADVR